MFPVTLEVTAGLFVLDLIFLSQGLVRGFDFDFNFVDLVGSFAEAVAVAVAVTSEESLPPRCC